MAEGELIGAVGDPRLLAIHVAEAVADEGDPVLQASEGSGLGIGRDAEHAGEDFQLSEQGEGGEAADDEAYDEQAQNKAIALQ